MNLPTLKPARPGVVNYLLFVVAFMAMLLPGQRVHGRTTQIGIPADLSITVQPTDKAVTKGGKATFIIKANTNSYQWQVNTGEGFTDIPHDDGPYKNTSYDTLNITPVSVAMHGYQYRCVLNPNASSKTISNTVTLEVYEPMEVTVTSPTDVSCNGGSDGSATVKISGGSGSYTLSRSGVTVATGLSAGEHEVTGLSAGKYEIKVEDERVEGSTFKQDITIEEPPALVITVDAVSNVTVAGGSDGSAEVSVSGGTGDYTYSWSPSGGTAASATGLTAGVYTVTITDENGCIAQKEIEIAEPSKVESVDVPTTNTYKAGDVLSFTVNTSTPITVITDNDVLPSIELTIGTAVRNAEYVETTSGGLIFSYTVQTGDNDDDGITLGSTITLNGATMRNAADIDLELALNDVAPTDGVLVYAVPLAVRLSTAAAQTVHAPFTVTATFSSEATGLTADDITVVNGTVSDLQTTDNTEYTFLVTPDAGGEVQVSIPEDAAVNIVDVGNSESDILRVQYDEPITGITLEDGTFGYDGTARSLEIAGTLPEGTTVTYTIDGEPGNSAVDAGGYEVTATISGDNYESLVLTADLIITPKAITVTAADAEKVYGEGDPELTYEVDPVLADGDTFTGALTRELGEDAGSYAIMQGDLSLSGNYTLTFEAGVLTIERAQPVITVAATQTHVYDGIAKSVVATVEPAELAGQLQYSPQGSFTNVGKHRVRVYLNGSENYLPAEAYTDFSITAAGQEGVTLPDLTVTYDGQPHALEVTGVASDATVAYTINGEEGNSAMDAGSYEVTATVTRPNYADETLTGTLYINKATAEITAAAEQVHTYDGTEKAVAATLSHGETELTYTPQQGYTNVGTYRVTVSAAETANYHAAAERTVTLRIAPAAQAGLELPSRTVTYTGRPHALPVVGLPVDATVAYTIDGNPGNSATDAGIYEVTAVVSQPNHADETLRGGLTIDRAPAFILGEENQVYVYDGTAKALAVELSHDEGELAYALGNNFTEAGTYTVTVSAPQTDNYETVSKTFILRIDRVERTLNFPALQAKTYGDAAFNAGATVNSGEEVSYTSSNPAVAEVAADGTVTIAGAGETTITATVPESGNYSSRPSVSQTLTVAKATQTITFNAPMDLRRDAGSVPLEVSASSDLPVELTIDDEEVATLSGTSLNVLRLGTVRITATQAGDANHEAAEPVTVTVRVTDPTADLPVRVQQAVSPNGDGINDYLIIEAIKDYPDNRVRIFNRNGTVVWEGSGYNNGTMAFRGIGTGQYNVPAGTYFYVAEIRVGNEWKYEKGWFVLKY